MNKDGQKVDNKQLKDNETCLKLHQKGKLVPASVEECVLGDYKGKVAKAEEKTVKDDAKLCVPLNPQPPFAYTGAATVNGAAVLGPQRLLDDIFGRPLDNSVLITKADNKETAACQLEMLKRADKLEDTILKEVVKAKKTTIKDPAVNTEEELETALGRALSSSKKITNTKQQLRDKVSKKCVNLAPAAVPATFPGECTGLDLDTVEECVIAAATCVACKKINIFDALEINCDLLDNQADDGSCLGDLEIPTP